MARFTAGIFSVGKRSFMFQFSFLLQFRVVKFLVFLYDIVRSNCMMIETFWQLAFQAYDF